MYKNKIKNKNKKKIGRIRLKKVIKSIILKESKSNLKITF